MQEMEEEVDDKDAQLIEMFTKLTIVESRELVLEDARVNEANALAAARAEHAQMARQVDTISDHVRQYEGDYGRAREDLLRERTDHTRSKQQAEMAMDRLQKTIDVDREMGATPSTRKNGTR